MDAFEHGMLVTQTQVTEIYLHTAGGATVAADSSSPRHLMSVLDGLSEDGWELVGSPVATQFDDNTAIRYFLRRSRSA